MKIGTTDVFRGIYVDETFKVWRDGSTAICLFDNSGAFWIFGIRSPDDVDIEDIDLAIEVEKYITGSKNNLTLLSECEITKTHAITW